MFKKVLGLLVLPYLILMFLEGCYDPQCDRRETRNITNIYMVHETNTSRKHETIALDMDYESYFVNNFKIDILPKAYARQEVEIDPCFEGFSNPIQTISVISTDDFNADYLAGSEINNLFSHNYSDEKLNKFEFNPYHGYGRVSSRINIFNDSMPTLDSIHTLYFEIYCADGKTYRDTLPNVNLNRTNQWYYY